MFYPDLSRSPEDWFTNRSWENYDSKKPVLSVGWLDPEHPHSRGEVSTEFVDALREIFHDPIIRHKGWHCCGYCELDQARGLRDQYIPKGSTVAEVIGDHAVYYVPSLIFHYVSDHQYLPPQEFIDAVLSIKDRPVEPPGRSSRIRLEIDGKDRDFWSWPVAEKPDEKGLIETVFVFRRESDARLFQQQLQARGRQAEIGAMNPEEWAAGKVHPNIGELRPTTPNDVFPSLQSAFYLQVFSTGAEFFECLFECVKEEISFA